MLDSQAKNQAKECRHLEMEEGEGSGEGFINISHICLISRLFMVS
jgi:hypothetical protein